MVTQVLKKKKEKKKKEGPCDRTRTSSDISLSCPQVTGALIRVGFFNLVRQNKCFQAPFGSTRKPNRLLSTAGGEAPSGCYRSLQASFSNGFLATATVVLRSYDTEVYAVFFFERKPEFIVLLM